MNTISRTATKLTGLPTHSHRLIHNCRVCNARLGPMAEYYRDNGVETWDLCADCHATACGACGSVCIDHDGKLKPHVRVKYGGVLSCETCH